MRKKLTTFVVEKTPAPATGRTEVFDEYTPGLALRITPRGQRTYVVRARIRGKDMPITAMVGDARDLTLEAARRRAGEMLSQMRAGIDPREAKQAAAHRSAEPGIEGQDDEDELTFGKLIANWSGLYLAHNHRERYQREAPAIIRRHFAALLLRPAAEITKAEVTNITDRARPGAIRNAIAAARACFAWAEKRGKVPGNPFADLPDAPTAPERERVLDDDELADIWTAAGTLGYPFGPYFKLLILSLQRRDQVAGIRWSEIDLDKATWRIPGPRMKMGRAHDVHLPEAAVAILRTLPHLNGSDFVFTSNGRSHISGYSQGKAHLDKAIGKLREAAGRRPITPWVPHDFRRSGVTWLAGAGFDSIVADKILAHEPTKLRGVARVYQRYEFARERAQALDAWAAHVTGQTVDNVTPLRAAQ